MKLKEIRKSKGMTQEDVARVAGINRSTYANIESGHRLPSLKVAVRISKALDVTLSVFMEEGAEHDA